MPPDGSRVNRLMRSTANRAGRQVERARQAYIAARDGTFADGLPQDETGRARVVCRRHAERRRVRLDEAGRPDCYDPGHHDCEGCVEDIRSGRVETW